MNRLALALLAACGAPQRPAPPACTADTVLSLGGQEDVDAAAGCTVVAKLTIRTGAPLDLAPLRGLRAIRGELAIGPTLAITEVQLPELRSVGSMLVMANGSLSGLVFPRLEEAGAITIDGNVALATVSLPRLRAANELAIESNADLGYVRLSSLATVEGTLRIVNNAQLAVLDIGPLRRVGTVRVENNAALGADVVDALRAKAQIGPSSR